MSEENNVVSIFSAKKKAKKDEPKEDSLGMEEIATKNKRNQERIARERANANKSTLRSYRIKH